MKKRQSGCADRALSPSGSIRKINDLIMESKGYIFKDSDKANSLCDEAMAIADKLKCEDSILEVLAAKAHIASFSGKDKIFDKYIGKLFEKSKQLKNYPCLEKAWTMKGAFLWNRSRYEESLKCFLESKKLIAKIKSPDLYALNKRNLGMTYGKLGNSEQAIRYFRSALTWAKKAENKPYIASINYWLGLELVINGRFKDALRKFFNALDVFEEIGDYYGAGISLNSIGLAYRDVTVFRDKDRFNNALEYFEKAKECAEKTCDKRLLADVYNNIGLVYLEKKDYEKTLENYFLSLKYRKMCPFKEHEAITLQNIGNVYTMKGDFDKGYKYIQDSLQIRRELGNSYQLINCLTNLLSFLIKSDRIEEAKKIYQELSGIEPDCDNPRQLIVIYDSLSSYLERIGRYQEALDRFKKSRKIEGELYQNDLDVQIKNIEEKHKLKIHKLHNEKKIATEKVKAARAMACTTCHEISQPVTVLQGYFELLLDKHQHLLQGKVAQSYIKNIRSSIKRINKILHILSDSKEIQFGDYVSDTDMVIIDTNKSDKSG